VIPWPAKSRVDASRRGHPTPDRRSGLGPPGREASKALMMAWGLPVASSTMSPPRAVTEERVVSSTHSSAPPARAAWNPAGVRAAATSGRLPAHRARRSVSCPTIPRPRTTTRSPGRTRARRTPCRAMTPNSTSAASSSEICSGTRTTRAGSTSARLAWGTQPATRSPTRSCVTPRPTASTQPTPEYPG
jgi:hypothetical protein